jgi:hypothetical protein
MEKSSPSMTSLFAQLGLASEPDAIKAFIAAHSPLPDTVALADAPFWSSAQAQFLREELLEDADWAVVIERLNAGMHVRRA